MSTGSEMVSVPTSPSPPNLSSPLHFPPEDRGNWRTQSLRGERDFNQRSKTHKMIPQHGRRESGQQRQQQQQQQQQGAQSGNTISRSMSRYRRRTSSVTADVDATQKINPDPPPSREPPSVPPVPTIPRQLRTADTSQKGDDAPATLPDSPPRHQLRHTDTTRRHTPSRSMADSYHQSRPSTAKSAKSARSEESAWRRLTSRDGRRNRVNSEEDDEATRREVARLEAENRRLLIAQKKKDLERLELELATSQKAIAQSQSHKPKSPVVEKFVSLTKGRKSKDALSPTSSNASIEPARPAPTGIEPGGRGIVPQTDAPQSAINAGDRNVAVRYRQHTLSLEVTPETTADDIIIQTAEMMSSSDMRSTDYVVIETYNALGLERRLRRYEHIRDVMNSWDRDTQNQLVIRVSNHQDDQELSIDSVPNSDGPPQGFQLYMYHSNRPGKWNKRWITLLDNGQILSAKKPNTNSADKDTVSLCRLSDYDIYTPTESQMRKHLKPPKRYCFVLRSQEKTTVYMNTENYAQYFCTDDPQIAAQFREVVQGWRSWCLIDRRPPPPKVSKKISIRKTDDKPPQISLPILSSHAPKKSTNVASLNGHRLKVSIDESPYSIGQFEPLLDMKRFDKRLSQFGRDFLPPVPDVSTMPKEIPTHHLPPSSKLEKKTGSKSDTKLIDTIRAAEHDGFTGSGLLGQAYEERRHTQTETERPERGRQRNRDDGFTNGPSLLSGMPLPEMPVRKSESPSWFPSALEHSARRRSPSAGRRPSTSAGVVNTSPQPHARLPSLSSPRPPLPKPSAHISAEQPHPHPLSSQPTGLSHSNRRTPPKPLINLESTFQEPPQWSKDKGGHGVKAPEGMTHLIDLITVSNPSKPNGGGHVDLPPRSALRRAPNTAPLPGLSRTRSKTQGAPAPRLSGNIDVPPVPSLPGRMAEREPLRSNPPPRSKERDRAREKREREYKEREAAYNAVPGRTGTLKVV
ncbi:hypothetical protein GGR52DRAFT_573660 [Hypoxylon sp. FL1284]|nr:hypothetical protein GGR52DRAFT_573660 [Hypoxylon sp. FL1284]